MRYIPVVVGLILTAYTGGSPVKSAGQEAKRTGLETAIVYLHHHPSVLQGLIDKYLPTGGGETLENHAQYDALCAGCKTVITFTKTLLALGITWDVVKDDVVGICKVVAAGEYPRTDILCPPLMDNFGPLVFFILKITEKSSNQICSHMNWCDPRQKATTQGQNVDSEFPGLKMRDLIANVITRERVGRFSHAVSGERDGGHSTKIISEYDAGKILKVAQLTDIHVEEDYLTGTATDCGLPTCCQANLEGTGKSGHWGDYSCNVPPRTIRYLLQSAAAHKPDFVIYSGDNPPHAIWKETMERQLNASRWAANEINIAFNGTRIFPNMGNHENFPTNMYYPPRKTTKMLNTEWGRMFTDSAGFTRDQLSTIDKAGYYTTLVRPGLRILAYNSNYGGTENFYNLLNYDRAEFKEMISWLNTTLSLARNNSEKVIITSHHEYGDPGNVVAFDEMVTPILAEYGDIIVLHPVGHVHRDEFKLNFDQATGDVKGVHLVAMTMNTRPHVNPSYRIFYLDAETFKPLGYDQYFLDVNKANENPSEPYPIVKLYSTREDYGLPDLTPKSYLDFYNRLMQDEELLQRYWYYRRAGTNADGLCYAACKAEQRCKMVSPTYGIYLDCMEQSYVTTPALY